MTPVHTPGPWLAEKPSKVWQVNAPATPIALVVERSSEEITHANARLIAAAPELLEIVKQFHKLMPSPESGAALRKAGAL